jgi:CheY-like chemotaxis protein
VWIKGVRPQVQQILLNFITNGLESLQGGRGDVLIRAGYRTAQEATTCGVTFLTTPDEGPLPFIEVVDTGAGMDAATQARIFDPLFTTKRTGHGLGLATVRNIVTTHHAWIGIRSSPATGTTILVMFPPSEDQPNTEDVMPSAEQPILLVEQDHLVRNMCESVLTIAGFRVVSVGTVDEIASLHDASGRSFRAAIVDASVDINLQALEQVRASVACPVLWTGASEAVVPTQATDGLLVKPFEPEELLTSVKQLLRGPP